MSCTSSYSRRAYIERCAAPPESVWAILTDAAAYSQWNPEIVAIDGTMDLGARITAHVRLGNGAVRRVPQRVQVFEPSHRMDWVGGLALGLFIGRREFTVTSVRSGRVSRSALNQAEGARPTSKVARVKFN